MLKFLENDHTRALAHDETVPVLVIGARGLFRLIVERDLRDASSGDISADWQYRIAYNASLKLCAILLHASGYEPERQLAHYRTLQALP